MSVEVPFLPLLGGHEARSESHFCSSALLSQGSLAACLGTFGDPGFLILDKLIGSKEVSFLLALSSGGPPSNGSPGFADPASFQI